MKKTLSFIIVSVLVAMMCVMPAAAQLETHVEKAPVTVEDIEWRFVPAEGGHALQSAATGKYLGRAGDAIAMVDDPVSWVYEMRSDDDLNNYSLYSAELDAPLRFSPNMSRYSLRTPFTYIGLFEKQNARYVKVTEVTDNAVYIVVGMVADDGVPKALTNFLETNDGSNMGGAAVDIVNDEYITFGEPEPEAEPEPVSEDISPDADAGAEPAEQETTAAANGGGANNDEDGETNFVIYIIIGAAALAVIIIIIIVVSKKKK